MPRTTKPRRKAVSKKREVATKAYVDRKLGQAIETKCFSGAHGEDNAVTSAGSIHDLSRILVGDSQGQRTSNQIMLKKLIFNAYITLGTSSFLSSDAFQNVRIILFRWRVDTQDTVPTPGDLVDNASSLTNFSVSMPYNYNERQKYEIIWDKVVQVAPEPEYNGSTLEYVAAGPNVNKIIRKQFFGKKLGAKHIKFDDGADATGHGYNKIYACFFSDSGNVPHANVCWSSQVLYEDA